MITVANIHHDHHSELMSFWPLWMSEWMRNQKETYHVQDQNQNDLEKMKIYHHQSLYQNQQPNADDDEDKMLVDIVLIVVVVDDVDVVVVDVDNNYLSMLMIYHALMYQI